MKREQIKELLAACDNPVRLIALGDQLKKKGEKESIVNRLVHERRMELVKKRPDIQLLKKETIPEINNIPIGHLPIQVQDLSEPRVIYSEDSILL